MTNDVCSDYQKKIDEFKKTFISQWDVLTKSSDEFTDSINDNVKKYSRLDSLDLLDKLMKRIKDKNDPLDNLVHLGSDRVKCSKLRDLY